MRELRVEVTPDSNVPVTDVLTVAVQATATDNPSEVDVVKADTSLQKLLRLEYIPKYGEDKIDVPADGGSFTVEQGRTFGLRAIKANPDAGWPHLREFPFLVPAWDNAGETNVGDEIWVRKDTTTGETLKSITASCGNTLPFKVRVRPGYVLRLSTDTRSLLTAGDEGRAAQLTATAVLRDGTAASGVKIRIVSTYADSPNGAAGTLAGDGLANGIATTDTEGHATAALTAGSAAGVVKVKAQLLGPDDEVWLETASLNFTFQAPPEP